MRRARLAPNASGRGVIPKRPDPRYKYTWTKGHKLPVYHGGTDDISNIQAECYECNFEKNAGALKPSP
ncbi:hypothetical protein HJB81_20640 [Rhizobium sp. NZLR1]|nr:hypothetical protein [Rhizobium sp. NZLR1]QSZ20000.1 HNH endonuclease [Rhizobium sp. NZLR1]